jgi:hypothetical protein
MNDNEQDKSANKRNSADRREANKYFRHRYSQSARIKRPKALGRPAIRFERLCDGTFDLAGQNAQMFGELREQRLLRLVGREIGNKFAFRRVGSQLF